jgi:anti-sigma factor ChrR (cupin superfamily)
MGPGWKKSRAAEEERRETDHDRHGGKSLSEKIVIEAEQGVWVETKIPGVTFKPLRQTSIRGAGTFIIKMMPDTSYPAHIHPGGEEVFVIEGKMNVGGDSLGPGDYLFTPPGGAHAARSEEGCMFLVVLPEPIRILD